ncbi:MAG: caspase family protein [Bacteroidales bacterium]|nr:caspase family protein [Bacteroidales bacterium]MCF8389836.1 caspase family protein [Bacteroidales bacterium]
MNRSIVFLAILFSLFFQSRAQQAEVKIFRPKTYSSALLNIQVLIDDKLIGILGYGERLVYYTNEFGNKTFEFKIVNAKNSVTLNIEPGGVYYIETNMGITKLKADLLEAAVGRSFFEDDSKYKSDSKPVYVYANGSDTHKEAEFQPVVTNEVTQSNHTLSTQSSGNISNASQKRIALIIGNGDYVHGGYLRNPLNDAEDMAAVLKNLGFEVILIKNADLVSLKSAIDDFGLKLSNFDVGLFYYAGHGIQSKGFNYFIPVDAELKSEAQVEFNCVRTDRLLSLMESASNSTNIIILDACRNNPFERSWSRSVNGSGLAFMDAPSGSLIAYSTSPGRTASDGYGRNGLYTSALLQHIVEPNISIELMFKKVRETVSEKSEKAQIPWESTSLVGNFYFASPVK